MKYNYPDKKGNFGEYGGRYVPEILEGRLKELEQTYSQLRNDKKFQAEFKQELSQFANRPSSLYLSKRLLKNEKCHLYFKREDLNHTGAHKINNAIGQILVARAMGKKLIIAETGAGQHGVATATVAARYGMKCRVYMGERDMVNQSINVYRMKLLGAEVVSVTQGQGTLKDTVDMALMAYATNKNAYYLLGSAVGPHPYPQMVRDFQSVIGIESRRQLLKIEGKLPDYVIACVGGGSNALGIFSAFIPDDSVQLIAVEPAGEGESTNRHGLSLKKGKPGIVHGFKCRILQNNDGSIAESYSAASGLDYPGVGPELSMLKDMNRLQTVGITDKEAMAAFVKLSRVEGIIPALESAHAIAYAEKLASTIDREVIILVNLSGRGDKDVETVSQEMNN
jgi:tryptophan synthase beta chain